MTVLAIWIAGIVIGFMVFDRLVAFGLRAWAHVHPTSLCGPDGFLVDTTSRKGVFD